VVSPFRNPVNHYHEQPGDHGDDAGEPDLEPGRKLLAQAEQAERDGDEEDAQRLRRILGD
jgi:hypothetical protein